MDLLDNIVSTVYKITEDELRTIETTRLYLQDKSIHFRPHWKFYTKELGHQLSCETPRYNKTTFQCW